MDSDRAKRILAALVREYISSGEPVPSSLLVSLAGVGVSSATGSGTVHNLYKVADFSGNYVAATAGAVVAGGAK